MFPLLFSGFIGFISFAHGSIFFLPLTKFFIQRLTIFFSVAHSSPEYSLLIRKLINMNIT